MHISYLKSKGTKFEDALNKEEVCKDLVENIQKVGVGCGLVVELHGEGGGVEQDGDEDGVFAEWRGGKGPQAVLNWILWNVSSYWLGVQSKLYAITLKQNNIPSIHFDQGRSLILEKHILTQLSQSFERLKV